MNANTCNNLADLFPSDPLLRCVSATQNNAF
jgi:hypothetical protein